MPVCPTALTVRLVIHPSRCHWLVALLVHGVATVAPWLSALPPIVAAGVSVAVGVHLLKSLRQAQYRGVVFLGAQIRLLDATGIRRYRLVNFMLLGDALTLLRMRPIAGRGRTRELWIWSDAADHSAYRALRRFLRWQAGAQASAGGGR